jgi:flagellar biosynthetic protein FliO
MGSDLLSTTIALLFVCALAIGALRALKRGGRARGMRLAARLPIEPRRSMVVVEVAGRWFLVGVGDGPMALLAELDAAQARAHLEVAAEPPRGARVGDALRAVLARAVGRGGDRDRAPASRAP